MIVGVPVINRPELLVRFLRSIDVPATVVVIDNSDGPEIAEACEPFDVTLVMPPANLGVAASWNLIIRSFPAEPYWVIANADTELGPGDVWRLAAEMTGARWVGMNGDWRVFGLTAAAVDRVGLFDENFHPIYCEDADYEYRCDLAGVERYFIDGLATHEGSAAIRSGYGPDNARTYPANVAHYEAKWGGHLRGGERFTSPFDRGGHVGDWRLDLGRLRELTW